MLVLTRKIGEQIVLPDRRITIDVVRVDKSHVALGVSAPPDIRIHRREVWDAIHGTGNGTTTSLGCRSSSLNTDESKQPSGITPSYDDLGHHMVVSMAKRAGGRIRHLSIEIHGDQIVIHGIARSFHARQLAEAAVQELLQGLNRLSLPSVEYDIRIIDH